MYTLADTRKLYYKNVSNVITNWIDSIFVEIYYVLWAFPAIVPVWICLLIMNTNFLLLCFRIKRNDKMFGFFVCISAAVAKTYWHTIINIHFEYDDNDAQIHLAWKRIDLIMNESLPLVPILAWCVVLR